MNIESGKATGKIRAFWDLHAWREGHALVLEVYKITGAFPQSEKFSLADQMRRCAVSITSNVAEGFGRNSYKEKARFYNTATASIAELPAPPFQSHTAQRMRVGGRRAATTPRARAPSEPR